MVIDLSVYGGAALMLAFDVRRATRDVDAVVNGAPDFLRRIAAEVAEEFGWPVGWLNDGVKGFISRNEKMQLMREFAAVSAAGGLRIHTPTAHYFFAMKWEIMGSEIVEIYYC